MPYANVNDIRMYYEEVGDPAATPLILLHGASGAIDYPEAGWGGQMADFGERYRAIHLEHRGHGRTNNPAGQIRYDMIADDVVQFIEHLGAGPAHIAGVSDGGITALVVGMTRPDVARSLVAVGPNYYNDELVKTANQFADLELMQRERPHEMALMASLHDRGGGPGWWRELFRQLAENLAAYPAYTQEDLARIPNPTLLIAGGNDLWGNLGQMVDLQRAIPRAELLLINNAPHVVQHTHAWIVTPQVLDFLARNPG
ncbi:MAG: alpha/beta hydrolase [Thermomicrobiales bacterium]|nr:alpha/beta hydrolase [Thermomicrobiales bacterium]